jgi:hypothetical protein
MARRVQTGRTDSTKRTAQMTDVFTMLRSDHRHVEDLLARLGESDEGAVLLSPVGLGRFELPAS